MEIIWNVTLTDEEEARLQALWAVKHSEFVSVHSSQAVEIDDIDDEYVWIDAHNPEDNFIPSLDEDD